MSRGGSGSQQRAGYLLRLAGIACLAAAGCASTPPDEDPVQIKLNDVDTRLARIERVVANQSLLDLANQGEALRADVRGLHNDIDEINHALDAARKQQRDLYADLDARLKALEGRRGGAAGGGTPADAAGGGEAAGSGSSPTEGGPDKASYQAAFDLLKAGQYDRAIPAFQKFLGQYPDSPLADNGQYWLGETYYVNRSYPEAESAFQHVIDRFPQSRKVPDALLKIGYCHYELKEWSAAREALSQLTTKYPDSTSARLGQQRLDKMAVEKH